MEWQNYALKHSLHVCDFPFKNSFTEEATVYSSSELSLPPLAQLFLKGNCMFMCLYEQGFVSVEVFHKVVESVLPGKPSDHTQILYSMAVNHSADTPGFINFDSLLTTVS